MAGKRRPQGSGRRALKVQLDNVLRAAARLDGIQAEAGEAFCSRVAAGMAAEIGRSIGTSGPESQTEPGARSY